MQRSNLQTLKLFLLMGAIFLAPFVTAWFLYFYTDHQLFGTTNKGQLLTPAFSVARLAVTDYQGTPELNKDNKWIIVYWQRDCQAHCLAVLDQLSRVRLALGKEMSRTRAWVVTETKLPPTVKETVADINTLAMSPLLVDTSKAEMQRVDSGYPILLVDPNGNVIMRYAEDAVPKAIHSDLKHLLKISKIG